VLKVEQMIFEELEKLTVEFDSVHENAVAHS
jgi:hypothetical protein